jgi:trypsin inhibitor
VSLARRLLAPSVSMGTAAPSWIRPPRVLGFLTLAPKICALALLLGAAALGGGCDHRSVGTESPDSGNSCALAGCGAPPLCGQGCQSACGCCLCTPGSRSGGLLCTDAGCYVPDDGSDAAADATAADAGWTQAPACLLAWDPGPCRGAVSVYAFVGGACVPKTYGGCQGNDNRFLTLEECMAVCEGRPATQACPAGRIEQAICLACGPAGGCSKLIDACALPCSDPATASCPASLYGCFAGFCQNGGCE